LEIKNGIVFNKNIVTKYGFVENNMKYLVGVLVLLTVSMAQATVCFSPQQNCEQQIVKLIYSAKHFVKMQSYTFTSYKIARALVNMKKKGIDVEVILDKSQFQCNYFSQRNFLLKHGVTIYEDYKPTIAHNKVIIVDGEAVETGSYNYTVSARKYNAENVLILHDRDLAQKYLANWQRRKQQSKRIHSFGCSKLSVQ
jgi:phosphatidylserine/phosphatidylglycerophosphate/cardiolipin synthase-like enzyme